MKSRLWLPKQNQSYGERRKHHVVYAKFTMDVGRSQVAANGAASQGQPNIDLCGHSYDLSRDRGVGGSQGENGVAAPDEDYSQKGQSAQVVAVDGIFVVDGQLLFTQHQRTHHSQHPSKSKRPRCKSVVRNVQSPQDLTVQLVEERPNPAQEEDLSQSHSANDSAETCIQGKSCSHCVQPRGRSKRVASPRATPTRLQRVAEVYAVHFGVVPAAEPGAGIRIVERSPVPEITEDEEVLGSQGEDQQRKGHRADGRPFVVTSDHCQTYLTHELPTMSRMMARASTI